MSTTAYASSGVYGESAGTYKAYRPIKPTTSKLLQRRWDQMQYDKHVEKVRSAGPSVDTAPPPTYAHLHLNMRKMRLEEERAASIERENKMLLNKVQRIMRYGSNLDHRNPHRLGSLNEKARERELRKINSQNEFIQKRIVNRQGLMSKEDWQKHWENSERYRENITAFPRPKRDRSAPNIRSTNGASKTTTHQEFYDEF